LFLSNAKLTQARGMSKASGIALPWMTATVESGRCSAYRFTESQRRLYTPARLPDNKTERSRIGGAVSILHRGDQRMAMAAARSSIAFALLYGALPNRRVALRDAVIGGLIASFAFEAMKRAFALYIAQVPTYTLVYGAFATLPVFLLWLYVSWLVVIFGAVVVASLPEWRHGAGQRQSAPGSDFFDALQLLKILWEAHRGGESVTIAELLGAATVRIENVERILDTMVSAGWIRRTVPNGWVLHRDAETVAVEDVFRLFVFRGDAHLPGREADAALETLVHEIGARIGEIMRMSLVTLFRTAQAADVLPVSRGGRGRAPGSRPSPAAGLRSTPLHARAVRRSLLPRGSS